MHGRGQVGGLGIRESSLGQSGCGPGTGTGFLGQLGLLVPPCVYTSGFSVESQEVPLPRKPGNDSYSMYPKLSLSLTASPSQESRRDRTKAGQRL